MNIYNKIRKVILEVLKKNISNLDKKVLDLITCEQPKNLKYGDLSSNALMIIRKLIKDDKEKIESEIISDLRKKKIFKKVNYVNPGFLNFTLRETVWYETLIYILNNEDYGFQNIGLNKKVNLEFISANPTGPLHVGHLRGAVFGDVLARLMKKNGFKVVKEYYVNDIGNQIDVLYETVSYHIENLLNKSLKARPKEMYHGEYLKNIAQEIIENKEYKKEKNLLKDIIISKVIKLIKRDLKNLGITFDSFISEKSIHEKGMLNDIIKKLNKKNLLYEGVLDKPKGIDDGEWKQEKQLIFKSSEYGDDSDRAIKKNNGVWTYFASDIAYHHYKVIRGFNEIINVWGADHAGYIKRVKASLLAMDHEKVKFNVKLCQIVNLLENNKSVKMSKRSGNFILIDDILKKIDKDVVRFFMMTRKNDAHLDFDLKKCLEETKENPIFYIQYAVARVNSLNNFFKEKGLKFKGFNEKLFKRFNSIEIDLLKKLSVWPKVVENSVIYKEPHRIVYYLIDLAGALHNYWSMGNLDSNLRVINETDTDVTEARLTLLNAISKVIRTGLGVLAIKPMEKM